MINENLMINEKAMENYASKISYRLHLQTTRARNK